MGSLVGGPPSPKHRLGDLQILRARARLRGEGAGSLPSPLLSWTAGRSRELFLETEGLGGNDQLCPPQGGVSAPRVSALRRPPPRMLQRMGCAPVNLTHASRAGAGDPSYSLEPGVSYLWTKSRPARLQAGRAGPGRDRHGASVPWGFTGVGRGSPAPLSEGVGRAGGEGQLFPLGLQLRGPGAPLSSLCPHWWFVSVCLNRRLLQNLCPFGRYLGRRSSVCGLAPI